jgi:hypothetical protein
MRDIAAGGGGGSRAPVFNVATGNAKLSASTGNSFDWQLLAIAGAIVLVGLYVMRK